MKKLITIESKVLLVHSFRGKLKEGLIRCKQQAKEYHSCVMINSLQTQQRQCEQTFRAYKQCLKL